MAWSTTTSPSPWSAAVDEQLGTLVLSSVVDQSWPVTAGRPSPPSGTAKSGMATRNARHGGDALGERGVEAGALGKRRGHLLAILAAAHDAPGELISGHNDRGVGIPHRLHPSRHAGLHHRGAGHHDSGGATSATNVPANEAGRKRMDALASQFIATPLGRAR